MSSIFLFAFMGLLLDEDSPPKGKGLHYEYIVNPKFDISTIDWDSTLRLE